MPPKKKAQKREEDEASDEDGQRLSLMETKLDSLASSFREEKSMRSNKKSKKSKKSKKKKRDHDSSSSSSSSDSSKKDSSSSSGSSSEMDDEEVTMWRPKNWPTEHGLRGQLANFLIKIESRTPASHLVYEAKFLKEMAMIAGKSKNSKLKAAIGRRIVVTLTKSEAQGRYDQVEDEMKAQLLGKGSKQWAKVKAKTLKKFRESKKFNKGKIFRKSKFKFRSGTGRKNSAPAGQGQ